MEETPHTEGQDITPSEPLPETPAHEHSRRKRELNLRKFNRQLTAVISISLKLVGVFAFLLLLFVVMRELRYNGYRLQEVHVPKEFEDAGITGNAIAAQITAHIQEIKHNVEHNKLNQWNYLDEKTVQNHFLESSSNEVQVELVGVGLSLNSVINLMSNSLGISQEKKITAFVKMNSGKAKLSVYVQNELPMEFDVNVDSLGMFRAADLITQNAAESILKITNTEMLMYYLLYRTASVTGYAIPTLEEKAKVVELAKFALRHDPDSTRYKYYYSFWGWAMLGRNNKEAYEKYKRTLSYDNQFVGGYTGMGWAARNLHQYEKAIAAAKQAIKILKSKNTKIPEDRRIHMTQWCYSDMGKYYYWQFQQDTSVAYLKDSAFHFITKSVYPAPKADEANFYSSTANFYWRAGLRDSAIMYSRRALSFIPFLENEVAAIRYNDLGFFHSEVGEYDSALVYEKKALEADSTYLDTYTTLAEIYGYKKDRQKFYYYLEKAFEKGYKHYTLDDLINPIPPYSFYSKEERYKKLWEKYVTK